MMQIRLSTLLLAFVVVGSALVVFGVEWGLPVAGLLLMFAVCRRSPTVKNHPQRVLLRVILLGLTLVVLVLPTLNFRRDSPAFSCWGNLRDIGLALLHYEKVKGCLPPAVVVDKQTKATHSWRILIAPYLGYDGEYKACNFREPWNGPNNSKIAFGYVSPFHCGFDPSIRDLRITSYVAVTGPGTVWDDHHSAGKPPRAMVIDVANSNINWMEPRDLTLDEACRGVGDGSRMRISNCHTVPGGFLFQDEVAGSYALFSDGTVWFIPAGLPPETLKGVFAGDEKAMQACTAYQRRIHCANCIAVAVLVVSYAALLLNLREAKPATPHPPAAADEHGEA